MPRKLKEARLHPEREIPAKQTSEDEAAERLLAQEPDLDNQGRTALGIDEDGRVVFEDELLEAARTGREVRPFTAAGTFIGDPAAPGPDGSTGPDGTGTYTMTWGGYYSPHAQGQAMDLHAPGGVVVHPTVYERLMAQGVDVTGARRYEVARRAQLQRDIEARCGEVIRRGSITSAIS